MLGLEPRASWLLGKCVTTEPCPTAVVTKSKSLEVYWIEAGCVFCSSPLCVLSLRLAIASCVLNSIGALLTQECALPDSRVSIHLLMCAGRGSWANWVLIKAKLCWLKSLLFEIITQKASKSLPFAVMILSENPLVLTVRNSKCSSPIFYIAWVLRRKTQIDFSVSRHFEVFPLGKTSAVKSNCYRVFIKA